MNECFKCGVSGEKARLFDVIASEGIVKICNNCSSEENLPLIKKPTTFQIKESEKQRTFQEKISTALANKTPVRKNDLSDKKNVSLRDIVDKNLKISLSENIRPRPDLIDNFHWVIMRMRRARHISREQFAKDLGESETLIKMIEQGILPEDDNKIINKIEGYFGMKLRKSKFEVKGEPREKELSFDSVGVNNLTISDLKEMKEKKEEKIFSKSVEVWKGDIEVDSEEKEKEEEERDFSQKDTDDLIFDE